MLSKKLLHDFKRIGKAIKIITDEDDKERRKTIFDLLISEIDRLYDDLQEILEGKE